MNKLTHEYRHFLSYPRDMRILLLTNLIYAFVLPVIDIFVAAYVYRHSDDKTMVVIYQLAVYTGIPFTFLINGFLLQRINIKRLYSAGMLLSGVSMAVMTSPLMTSLGTLSTTGVGVTGLLMGMSFGLFWANRDFLALSTTNDDNRNYYYGVETFFYSNTYVLVPFVIGWFIECTDKWSWFGGNLDTAYRIVTACVFLLTIISSIVVHRGQFQNPPDSDFIFFRFHWLWNRMQLLAILKGLAQGYIVTAPAMLVMRLVGKEGALGTIGSAAPPNQPTASSSSPLA
jgi:YQGE family putative transporter